MKMIETKYQHGFTLVEVMIALIVLAVGMLGIASLYITSLRSGHMAVSYTSAVTLAADMADRIRVNSNATAAYTAAAAGNGVAGADNSCVNAIAENVDCTPIQLAADDWFWWYEDVKQRMPVGRSASINVVNVPPVDAYTIVISWPERGQAAPVQYSMTFSL